MTGSAALRLASDGFASFGPRGELRKKVGEAGRIHLDRWLPFIVLHRSSDPENGIARRMAMNSPSYLIWSPDEDAEARAALDAVLPAIREKLGPVIVFELADEDWKPHAEDSPGSPTSMFAWGIPEARGRGSPSTRFRRLSRRSRSSCAIRT
ncbi:hypothetical protein H9L14_03450 [Sphingomonas sediminicola]|uniref:Uncharacterized protein n=1 Tax=Sphingomonas sediminicola TaxID=386874 RepID=A0ABX6TBF1_9SPHN|nr:hypothetical protein [Sphingomonas sediminicola]QNP46287.1 hypothetical protein H9L14_03450 [Sphingomonas sediminicola]